MNVHSYTTELKDEYKIDVYFNNEIDLSKALDVFNKILLIDGIENGSFIDKDVAAEIFRKEFDENTKLFDIIESFWFYVNFNS